LHKFTADAESGSNRAQSSLWALIMRCAWTPVSLYLVVRTATCWSWASSWGVPITGSRSL